MKILFVTSRFPWPLDKGDKLRAFNQVRYLSRKHEIVLFAISEEKVESSWFSALQPFCSEIRVFHLPRRQIIGNLITRLFSKLPFQSIYYYNPQIRQNLKEFVQKEKPAKIIFQLVRTALYANDFPKADCVIDLMDCFSYHYLLRSKNSYFLSHLFYAREYKRLKRYELSVINKYRKVLVISEKDRSLLPGNKKHVYVVGNGVEQNPARTCAEKSTDILFLGNLHYGPNINAARFLIDKVYPLLKEINPGITLTIAGIDAGKHFKNSEGIKVLENIEETRSVFLSARVFVAAMFLSTGIQNKILEAMSYEVPVITTPNAADALGAINGKQLLTAVSAEEFCRGISEILSSPELASKLAKSALSFISEHCDWQTNIKLIENLLSKNSIQVEAAQVS